MKRENHLIEGPILKTLLSLSFPIVMANILQTVYQLTDAFWVGRLGADALAAISISFPIIFLIVSLGSGLSMAGTILVSQYKGKNDQGAINHVTAQTLFLVFFVSLTLAVIGYLISPALVGLMMAEPEVHNNAVVYMKISFMGMVFVFTYMVFQSLIRGIGDVKTPIYIVLATVLLNLILDPVFIFGYGSIPAFGVGGAAVSTIFTQGVAAAIGLFLLFKGKYHIQLNFSDLKPDVPLIKKMFRLGLPTSIEQSTRALGMTVMVFLVAKFGTIALAAYGIGSRILSFIIIPAMGLSMATATLIGQNFGAKKMDRVDQIAKVSGFIGFFSLSLVGMVIFLFATQISAAFVPGEIETIQSSALFTRTLSVTFGFVGVQMALSGALMGVGNTKDSMIISIFYLWCLRFPLAYILSTYTSLAEIGLWLAFPISNVIAALIIIVWFMRGTWKNKRIIEDIQLKRSGGNKRLSCEN